MTAEIKQWFIDHWEGVIATIALIQPWIYLLWKWLFRKPVLQIYPSGTVEVGFSEFGPTIGMYGTLRSEHGDIFVKRMRLRVKNVRTKEDIYSRGLLFGHLSCPSATKKLQLQSYQQDLLLVRPSHTGTV